MGKQSGDVGYPRQPRLCIIRVASVSTRDVPLSGILGMVRSRFVQRVWSTP